MTSWLSRNEQKEKENKQCYKYKYIHNITKKLSIVLEEAHSGNVSKFGNSILANKNLKSILMFKNLSDLMHKFRPSFRIPISYGGEFDSDRF